MRLGKKKEEETEEDFDDGESEVEEETEETPVVSKKSKSVPEERVSEVVVDLTLLNNKINYLIGQVAEIKKKL